MQMIAISIWLYKRKILSGITLAGAQSKDLRPSLTVWRLFDLHPPSIALGQLIERHEASQSLITHPTKIWSYTYKPLNKVQEYNAARGPIP